MSRNLFAKEVLSVNFKRLKIKKIINIMHCLEKINEDISTFKDKWN